MTDREKLLVAFDRALEAQKQAQSATRRLFCYRRVLTCSLSLSAIILSVWSLL